MPDPGLPKDALEAVEGCYVVERPSGTLLLGLRGEPFYLHRLPDAIKARFPELESQEQRDELADAVFRHLRAIAREEQRSDQGGIPWLERWRL